MERSHLGVSIGQYIPKMEQMHACDYSITGREVWGRQAKEVELEKKEAIAAFLRGERVYNPVTKRES